VSLGEDVSRRCDAIQRRKLHIEQNNIRTPIFRERHRLTAVCRFADHSKCGLSFEQQPEITSNDRMMLCENDADRLHTQQGNDTR